jgi:TPR repeat protein
MDIAELKRKAAAGSCVAQGILGVHYLEGIGVDVDYQEAFRLLSAAANQGASRAIANLADMYAQGLGIPQDIAKAIQLYERVGKVEFFAAIALGRIYSNRVGVPVDLDQAFEWYSAAVAFEGRVADCDELSEAKAYVSSSKRPKPNDSTR